MNVWHKNRRRRRRLRTKKPENVAINTYTYTVSNFRIFNTYADAWAYMDAYSGKRYI